MTDIITTISTPQVVTTDTVRTVVIEGSPESSGLIVAQADGNSSTVITRDFGATILQTTQGSSASTIKVTSVGPPGGKGDKGDKGDPGEPGDLAAVIDCGTFF